MHRTFALVAVLAAAGCFAVPAGAQTLASAYTSLDLAKCRHTPSKEPDDYGEWRCLGYGSIAVYVAAGDQRIYMSFGPNAKKEPAAKQTLASFNSEGKVIEWRAERSADGKLKPFATIMRWNTTVGAEDPPVRGEVLVITRLGPPGRVCHVGYVDVEANPDFNALGQKIADDTARNFLCGADKPVISGKKGPGFSGPYGG
jgi:hypothetical protein